MYVGRHNVEQQHTPSVDCNGVKLSHIITCLRLMLYSEVTCLGDTILQSNLPRDNLWSVQETGFSWGKCPWDRFVIAGSEVVKMLGLMLGLSKVTSGMCASLHHIQRLTVSYYVLHLHSWLCFIWCITKHSSTDCLPPSFPMSSSAASPWIWTGVDRTRSTAGTPHTAGSLEESEAELQKARFEAHGEM